MSPNSYYPTLTALVGNLDGFGSMIDSDARDNLFSRIFAASWNSTWSWKECVQALWCDFEKAPEESIQKFQAGCVLLLLDEVGDVFDHRFRERQTSRILQDLPFDHPKVTDLDGARSNYLYTLTCLRQKGWRSAVSIIGLGRYVQIFREILQRAEVALIELPGDEGRLHQHVLAKEALAKALFAEGFNLQQRHCAESGVKPEGLPQNVKNDIRRFYVESQQLDSSDYQPWLHRGILVDQEVLPRAIFLIRQMIEQCGSGVVEHQRRGALKRDLALAYSYLPRLQNASGGCDAAAETYYEIGVARLEWGQHEEAFKDFESGLSFNPVQKEADEACIHWLKEHQGKTQAYHFAYKGEVSWVLIKAEYQAFLGWEDAYDALVESGSLLARVLRLDFRVDVYLRMDLDQGVADDFRALPGFRFSESIANHAFALEKAGKFQAAFAGFEVLMAVNSKVPEWRLTRMMCQAALGAEVFASENRDVGKLFCDRARQKVLIHDRSAFDDFNQAVNCDPDNPDFLYARAEYRVRVLKDYEVTSELEKIREVCPDHDDAFYLLTFLQGHAFLRSGNGAGAQARFTSIIDRNASRWLLEAYFFRGMARAVLKNFQLAREDYARVRELQPERFSGDLYDFYHAELLFILGVPEALNVLLMKRGYPDKAEFMAFRNSNVIAVGDEGIFYQSQSVSPGLSKQQQEKIHDVLSEYFPLSKDISYLVEWLSEILEKQKEEGDILGAIATLVDLRMAHKNAKQAEPAFIQADLDELMSHVDFDALKQWGLKVVDGAPKEAAWKQSCWELVLSKNEANAESLIRCGVWSNYNRHYEKGLEYFKKAFEQKEHRLAVCQGLADLPFYQEAWFKNISVKDFICKNVDKVRELFSFAKIYGEFLKLCAVWAKRSEHFNVLKNLCELFVESVTRVFQANGKYNHAWDDRCYKHHDHKFDYYALRSFALLVCNVLGRFDQACELRLDQASKTFLYDEAFAFFMVGDRIGRYSKRDWLSQASALFLEHIKPSQEKSRFSAHVFLACIAANFEKEHNVVVPRLKIEEEARATFYRFCSEIVSRCQNYRKFYSWDTSDGFFSNSKFKDDHACALREYLVEILKAVALAIKDEEEYVDLAVVDEALRKKISELSLQGAVLTDPPSPRLVAQITNLFNTVPRVRELLNGLGLPVPVPVPTLAPVAAVAAVEEPDAAADVPGNELYDHLLRPPRMGGLGG